MTKESTQEQIIQLSQRPLYRRILHRLFGHDYEIIEERHEWWRGKSKYEPTSFRVLQCNDCGRKKRQFFSEIACKWL